MIKRMLIMLTLLVLFFGALFGWKMYVNAGQGSRDPFPPVTISATAARAETWTPSLTAVGSLRTENGVNVTAQAPGLITALYFESGAEVNAGDLVVSDDLLDDSGRFNAKLWQNISDHSVWTYSSGMKKPYAPYVHFQDLDTVSYTHLTLPTTPYV